ncbi:MAG: GNAT family acetyltransferase [Dorea sp.]|nr:GNAT family acetyltransferase [Dorea sp.]
MIATPGLSINFLKKENYTGSHAGLRYYLNASKDKLHVCIYPEPWCFEATPDEDKQWMEFPLSPEGLEEAIEWISKVSKDKNI